MTCAGLKGRCFFELKSILLEVGYIKKWPKFAYLESKVPHLKFQVMWDRVYLSIWLNLTPPQKNRFKTVQKVNVEPDMATYWFNSVKYKYLV